MSAASERIREFHEAFDVTAKGGLKAICAQRIVLHDEEANEVEDALCDLRRSIPANRRERLEALASELADDLIIAYGTADLLGVDLDRAFELKMEANFTKLGEDGRPLKNSLGKVLKGPNYVEADMSEVIRETR